MSKFSSTLAPILVGALLHAGLWAAIGWLYSDAIARILPSDGAVRITMPWLQLLHTVLPGLAAGYLCKSRPFATGFLAVATASLAMFPIS
jgi:hypothetical protein